VAFIALHTTDQAAWIPRCLARPHITKLVLEKAVAPTPL
jgi:hypothetical protein